MQTEYYRWHSPNLGHDMEMKVYGYYGKPVLVYDLKCVGSEAYLRLATEIIQREKA